MNIWSWRPSYLLMAPVEVASEAGEAADGPSDQELIKACQSGDASAFEVLVTRHRGKVYAMVQQMIKNDADAWDLSQEVFIKVWKALPRFEARAKFSTWLYRITHNVVYDWLRKRKIDSAGELDDSLLSQSDVATGSTTTPNQAPRPDEALENSELGDRIKAALATLSPEHRETILLREVQGFDYKEIAKAMDCSLGTVMSRLYYARKKLQTLLTHENGEN
ncbi:MAG: RNA polymerase sigma factor [Akkermansiaceae bacterium]